MISGDTGQTPNEGQTAGSQSVENSGTALRMAGAEVRALLLDLAAKTARRRSGSIDGGRWRHFSARWPQGRLWRPRRRPRSQPRGDRKGAAQAASRPPDRGQVHSALRHPGESHGRRSVRPGHPPSRHAARPRDTSAALRLDARQCRRGGGQALPGVVAVLRDGSFLGVVAEREEQAIKAREALTQQREMDSLGPELPGSGTHLRRHQVAAEPGFHHRRQAGAARRRTLVPSRRSTPSLTWRMPRSDHRAQWPSSRTAK